MGCIARCAYVAWGFTVSLVVVLPCGNSASMSFLKTDLSWPYEILPPPCGAVWLVGRQVGWLLVGLIIVHHSISKLFSGDGGIQYLRYEAHPQSKGHHLTHLGKLDMIFLKRKLWSWWHWGMNDYDMHITHFQKWKSTPKIKQTIIRNIWIVNLLVARSNNI